LAIDQDREPERAADLLARVDEAGCEPRVVGARPGHRGDGHGDEGEAQADGDDERGEQDNGVTVYGDDDQNCRRPLLLQTTRAPQR